MGIIVFIVEIALTVTGGGGIDIVGKYDDEIIAGSHSFEYHLVSLSSKLLYTLNGIGFRDCLTGIIGAFL